MPLVVISAEEKCAGVEALDAELRFLLEERKLTSDTMGVIGHLGIVDVSTLAHIEESETSFRKMVETEIGLVASEGMAARIQIAKLIDVWHASRERNHAKNAEATTARIDGRQRELLAQTFVSARRLYQERHGKFEDEHFPSRECLQMKIEQLEDGELRTESLTELVSVKEVGDECSEDSILFDVGNRKVALRTSRAKIRVRAPATTEELRMRVQLMKIQFEVTRGKFADRLVFAKYDQTIWGRYISFILGPRVAGYSAHAGTKIRWEDLLSYDFALRKFATDHVNDGHGGFTEGLGLAMKDGDLQSTFFFLPQAVSGKRGQSAKNGDGEEPPSKLRREISQLKSLVVRLQNSQGKGDSKGQRKGARPSGADQAHKPTAPGQAETSSNHDLNRYKETEQLKFRTEGPNAKQLCQFFQRNGCTRTNCRFVHICWRCHKKGHGIVDCTMPPKHK